MSPKQPRQAANLFAAAGMEQDAPHPLPDKLRPRTLADVVGQDHILGPDGALTRMLETRTLGSLIFWGPPGTGKTTVARLLADATELHFEQLSAVFSGVADLKRAFDAARARRNRIVPAIGLPYQPQPKTSDQENHDQNYHRKRQRLAYEQIDRIRKHLGVRLR